MRLPSSPTASNQIAHSLNKTRGFALVIALSLMAFILLLLLSITTLVQVETTSANISLDRLTAESNALLAVQQAIGELQRYTGEDRITTASADLFIPTQSNEIGLVSPFWTGVWSTQETWASDPSKTYYENQVTWDALSQEEKLNQSRAWLVSGWDPDATPRLTPRTVIDSENKDDFAKLASLPPVDLRPVPNGAVAEGIFVPKVSIEPAGGLGGGNFAWWVADENAKAKINIKNPYHDSDSNPVKDRDAERYYRSVIAQRTGIEFPLEISDQNIETFDKLLSTQSLEILNTQLDLPAEYIHDYTAYSAGILTDQRKGGLRKDLSIAFDIPLADLYKSSHHSGANDVFDESSLPDEMYTPVSDTSRTSTDSPQRRENYIFTLENVTQNEDLSFVRGNTFSSTSTIDSARWSVLAYHHNLYHYLNNPNSRSPTIETQRAWQASDNFVAPGGINGGMNYTSGNKRNFSETKNPANAIQLAPLTKYKGQLHRNNTASVLDEPDHFWEAEELTTYPITPIVTELMLIVNLEYTATGEVLLKYSPMVEITNPYDVSIRPNEDLQVNIVADFATAPNLVDFRLFSSLGSTVDNIWSALREEQTSSGTPYFTGGDLSTVTPNTPFRQRVHLLRLLVSRSVEIFMYSNIIQPSNNNYVTRGKDYSFLIQQGNLGTLAPGETKSFVLDPGTPDDAVFFDMVQGTDPENTSLTKLVRPFEEFGNALINFKNATWPEDPSRFDTLETEMTITPRADIRIKPLMLEVVHGFADHVEQKGSTEMIRMNPSAATDSGVFQPSNQTLTQGTEITLYALHMERRSLDDYQTLANQSAVAGNELLDSFLGSFNPRALVSDNEHGIYNESNTDELNFGTPTWRVTFNTDGSVPDTAGIGSWGSARVNADPPIFFHLPRRPPISIGEYRHANLGSFSYEPAYVIGSSLNPLLTQRDFFADRTSPINEWISGWGQFSNAGANTPIAFDTRDPGDFRAEIVRSNIFPDLSYLYNSELWDSYYLSTLTNNTIQDHIDGLPLPNARMQFSPKDPDTDLATLQDYQRNAASFTIDGAFNVNSTSVAAWTAQLMSMRNVGSLNDSQTDDHAFLRLPTTTSSSNEWDGFNTFDQTDLESLASVIVEEIKARGPFMSLAHFINRQLVNDDRGLSGALHGAISQSNINGSNYINSLGALTQGDILTSLGPTLSARGDTFMIRTKGEATDPITGRVKAVAYCQAIVQRLPEYVDGNIDSNNTHPDQLVSTINQQFGRKYQLVSIQWIPADQL